jgi:hypothetical protein
MVRCRIESETYRKVLWMYGKKIMKQRLAEHLSGLDIPAASKFSHKDNTFNRSSRFSDILAQQAISIIFLLSDVPEAL